MITTSGTRIATAGSVCVPRIKEAERGRGRDPGEAAQRIGRGRREQCRGHLLTTRADDQAGNAAALRKPSLFQIAT